MCAAGKAAYVQSLEMLRNCGTLVCVGIVTDHLPVSPFEMLVRGKQAFTHPLADQKSKTIFSSYRDGDADNDVGIRIVGSSVGTNKHMDELLALAVAGKVQAKVEVAEFNELQDVLDRLARHEIDGRVVVKIPA